MEDFREGEKKKPLSEKWGSRKRVSVRISSQGFSFFLNAKGWTGLRSLSLSHLLPGFSAKLPFPSSLQTICQRLPSPSLLINNFCHQIRGHACSLVLGQNQRWWKTYGLASGRQHSSYFSASKLAVWPLTSHRASVPSSVKWGHHYLSYLTQSYCGKIIGQL